MKFADVGELGWAMYLSAHINWLQENGSKCHVYTNRPAMYECSTSPVDKFPYWDKPADGFGRYGVSDQQIRKCFKDLAERPHYGCDWWFRDKTLYRPYVVKRHFIESYIAVCPRFRPDKHHAKRNLPKEFYEKLIKYLLRHYWVITLGTKEGSYGANIDHKRFISMRGKTDVKTLIELLTAAHVCIGGTSAPPKIAALQGTPTYVIGHEKKRFTEEENWSNTRMGFWELEDYQNFDEDACIGNIMLFVGDTPYDEKSTLRSHPRKD